MDIMKTKFRRLTAAMLVLLLLVLCITGCGRTGSGGDSENNSGDSSVTEGSASTETRSFTDDCGRTVDVPMEIDEVIASGNLSQVVIFALAPDTLIAINGSWTEDAAEYVDQKYLDLPEVGSFFGNHDLNYEEIARLAPDIIIDVGEAKPDMKSDLDDITAKTGIPAVHIDGYYDTMDEAFIRLGGLLGKETDAEALSTYCKEALDAMDEVLGQVEEKKTVMYCTQEDGLNVLAKDSYHSQIIDALADNVAVLETPSSKGSGNEVNLEQMMIWDPEIIVFAPGSYYEYVSDDPAWASLKAVKAGKYYEVPSGPYNWMGQPPSSNRILGIYWFAELLYPDKTTFDIKEKTFEYYKLFYHCELTEEKYNDLIAHSLLK